MDKNVELRKLPMGSLYSITNILEIDNSWQKVMALIPKDPQSEHFEQKYNSEHMRLIKEHARNTQRKCSEVLFDEWGTSGRIRPTAKTLLDILAKAEIYRAADEIALLIQEPLPLRPKEGPAAQIETNITILLNGQSMDQKHLSVTQTTPISSRQTESNNQALHNGPTKAIQSVSDFIKFPESKGMKHDKSYGKQTTAQMKSDSKNYQPDLDLKTEDLPDFSALMVNPNKNISDPVRATESSSMSDIPSLSDVNANSSGLFQMPSSAGVDLYSIDGSILSDLNLIEFKYGELEQITNNFLQDPIETVAGPIGKIGMGGFGEVFAGHHSQYGCLAIKKVHCYLYFNPKPAIAIKVFNTEVMSLSHLRHSNIVPILGYSINGPTPCIVCKFIEGGSLSEKIADRVLTEDQRMKIMLGTADGLKYIHNTIKPTQPDPKTNTVVKSTSKTYYLHGDVKSANILLTKDCVPKLCDFGLAKQLDTTYVTSAIMGTSAYMPLEGFSGTITRKTDIFSFGIVLLELLTGLPPIVISNDENLNIKSYVETHCGDGDITNLLDDVVTCWTKGQKVYELARKCLEDDRNLRPSMDEVCAVLNRIGHPEHFDNSRV